MTAAPTPRDGEKSHEGLPSHCMTANDLIGLILGPQVDFNTHKQALEMIWKYRDAHVARRVAEAVGPLEAENRALRAGLCEIQEFIWKEPSDAACAAYSVAARLLEGTPFHVTAKALAPKEGNAP